MAKLNTGSCHLQYKYHLPTNRHLGFIIYKNGRMSKPFFSKAAAKEIIAEAIDLGYMPRLNGVRLYKVLSRTFQKHKLPRHATVHDCYNFQPLTYRQ